MRKMKAFILALAVVLAFPAGVVSASGYDLAYKNIRNLNELEAASIAAGDFLVVWDDSVNAWTKVDATDFPYGGGDITLDDGSGVSPDLIFQDGTDETSVFEKADAGYLKLTTTASDGLNVLVGNLAVGNGTPGETINGEDLYVEGISEFDGTANFDGVADFDGGVTVGSSTVNTATLTAQGRMTISICGDATTVNNNAVYYGPSQVLTSSATAASVVCDSTAVGNVTEATADAPALTATAFYPLGMVCYQPDSGNTITYTLRSAAAGLTPAIAVSIADNELVGTASATATTAVASGATLAVAVASSGNIGTLPFRCDITVAF